jgi:acetyl-CoA C-acetyltransferase/3-oxo-5,6-didehydrosuberyl-CoA/3-oxoadipyl-CoA thiolase
MSQRSAFVVDALRTPIGRYGGGLAEVRADDLAAIVIKALVERTRVPTDAIDDVVFGCANQAGEDNRNVARMGLLLAGLPVSVPGVTVNRLCGSGMQAVGDAARLVANGEAELVVAGGVEQMTRAPLVTAKPTTAFPRGEVTMFDTTLGWRFVNPRMKELHGTLSMGETAEAVAERCKVSREAQDALALASQKKAGAAIAAGRFAREIVPVPLAPGKDGKPRALTADEHPRPETTIEQLQKLKPAFARGGGGTVTAGNSSGINDGAAALLLAEEETAHRFGLKPLARVGPSATAGVDPACMGIGPVPATRKLLGRAGLRVQDLDIIEINEAFAVQVLACVRDLGLEGANLNPNGGAIALGHPLGCTGARLVTTLVHEMRRTGARRGLATLCVGVGQGVATLIEGA